SMLVTLPFVLLLLDVWPLRRLDRQNARQRVVEKLPILVLCAIVSVVTYVVQRRGGAVMSLTLVPFLLRAANAVLSYAAYLRMSFWLVELAPIYPFPHSIPAWQPVLAAIILVLISVGVWKGRAHGYLITGWLWFLGTLVPVIGLVQVGEQARADRYTYV